MIYRKKEGHPIKRGLGWDVGHNETVGYWMLLIFQNTYKVRYFRWRQHAPTIYNVWENDLIDE